MKRAPEPVERQGLNVKLDIGRGEGVRRAGEGAQMRRRHRERTPAAQRIVRRHQGAAPELGVLIVQGRDPAHPIIGPDLQVILQIFADPRPVEAGLDAQRLQAGAIAYARQFQKLRRGHGSGAQDHFTVAARGKDGVLRPPFNPAHPLAIQDQALDLGAGDQFQIGPGQDGF